MNVMPTTQIDFSQVAELGDELLQRLNVLREAEPIAWNDSANAWIVSRYEDVSDGFLEKVPVSCIRFQHCYAHIPAEDRERYLPVMMRTLPHWILNSDPPSHTRLRKLMLPAFSRRVVENLRPFVQDTTRRVLDQAGARDAVEFVDDIARAITGRVIMKLSGIPEEHLDRLRLWSFNLNVGFGSPRPPLELLRETERSLVEMAEIFDEQIALRRREPREDFLTALVQARDGSDRLSTDELHGMLYVTLIAGHDTTMNTMTLATAALANNPAARDQLLDAGDKLVPVLMELMRYVAMSTAFPRFAKQDFEWHGKQIREGDALFLMTAGANRDPRIFPHPEAIDPGLNRDDRVLSFGTGPHHCIGHLLAKMQLSEILPDMFRRFDVRLLDEKLQFAPQLSQRGLEQMRVRLTPREKQA